MRALVYDTQLRLASDWPEPSIQPGWATLRVLCAGICRTDLELTRGYMGFRGVLGHEFVGRVEACDDTRWLGKRVVGEINAGCGDCPECARGLSRHCRQRSVLGILKLDGCLAERCSLPIRNLLEVPAAIDDETAVFMEPLSAACEILEQIPVEASQRCVVLGDGKLGILCAWVLAGAAQDVTLVGRHPEKLELARWRQLKTVCSVSEVNPGADLVVEATGSESGLGDAMGLCRPHGTLVLKSTLASQGALNLAPIVVNELQVVGSRCGPFARGLAELEQHQFPLSRLIAGRYSLGQGLEAFDHAARKGALKVLVRPGV